MKRKRGKNTVLQTVLIGGMAVVLVIIIGTIWMSRSAGRDTEQAIRSVSLFYLEELAGRREQVVSDNIQESINTINVAIDLMDEDDLRSPESLSAYQARIKKLYGLEKFAFVDEDGLIYTAQGTLNEIDRYEINNQNLTQPMVYVQTMEDGEKRVVIAVPVKDLKLGDKQLKVCFMEIGMENMLSGVSMTSDVNGTTFCNLYTPEGTALTNMVLGGLASEDNLLEAMQHAQFEEGYSYEQLESDFKERREGVVSFTYNGIPETLSYVPVEGTNWMLTYLIRESQISERVGSITEGILGRGLLQTIITAMALLGMFAIVIAQSRKSSRLLLEKETTEAANRAKQEELEQRLALQEELLRQESRQAQQESMITALSSDYRSVYYVDLDKDEGICYQPHSEVENGLAEGEHFAYRQVFADYAANYVTESYREAFLAFVEPEQIREGLKSDRVISFRYLVSHAGRESYEMVKFAGVRHPEDRTDQKVHAVGVCFSDVDMETRKTMAESEALSTALSAAEDANRAKTAFLSSMSHEIRTPMNAIIGLNNIAMNDPETPEKTKEYLVKMGDSAHHLLNIINDILDMSRIESGRMAIHNEEFYFPKTLEQVNAIISGQCREKGLHYECRISGKLEEYYIGDDMKLRQVMINILGNAVKFTPEGGSVTFTIGETARYDGKSTLRLIMTDTGIGMSEEYLPKLFDAFSQEDSNSTNRYGSTGLGMPITKSMVELMNGTIEVQSRKGVGTTFIVTITLSVSERPDAATQEGDLEPGQMHVLVIDDDPVAIEHASIVLSEVGVSCESATSGAEALEMVKMRQARMEPYNLILVDWKMPDMDGLETTRQIRAMVGNDTPIIILTSYNWDDVVDEAKEAGVDTFAAKPLFAANVMDEFREAFRKKRALMPDDKARLEGRRILLAEDIDVNAQIMVMVLDMRQIEAEVAVNGRLAVDMFAEHPAGYYDAILMDMRMPEMDGLEATKAIRAMDREDAKKIPIIALTANAFDEDVQRSMQAGLNAHLSKPVEPDILFETLENLL